MKKLTTILVLAAFSVFGLIATNDSVEAKTIELKFGHVGAPGSLFLACADEFAKRANAKLGDKAKVTMRFRGREHAHRERRVAALEVVGAAFRLHPERPLGARIPALHLV